MVVLLTILKDNGWAPPLLTSQFKYNVKDNLSNGTIFRTLDMLYL